MTDRTVSPGLTMHVLPTVQRCLAIPHAPAKTLCAVGFDLPCQPIVLFGKPQHHARHFSKWLYVFQSGVYLSRHATAISWRRLPGP